MGTWIAHLRIAESLLASFPELDETMFAYGNLAPDSGMPNADWTAFDPPKEVTHFLVKGEGEDAVRDYRFYQQYLAALPPNPENQLYSFRLGYFFHLICDSLWSRKIVPPTQAESASALEANARKAWDSIKYDWYSVDQAYVHQHPDSLFWRTVAAKPTPLADLPYLPQAAFEHQMAYIRQFYRDDKENWAAPRRYPYLNERTMAQVVTDSAALVLKIWGKREQFEEAGERGTTVALLEKDDLEPYEPPLGDNDPTPL
jgi:Zinc dependent phospholipase C